MMMNIAVAESSVPVDRVKTIAFSEPMVQGTRSGTVYRSHRFIGSVKFRPTIPLIRSKTMIVNRLFFEPNADLGVIIRQPERETRASNSQPAASVETKKPNAALAASLHIGAHVDLGESHSSELRNTAKANARHTKRHDTDPSGAIESIQLQSTR